MIHFENRNRSEFQVDNSKFGLDDCFYPFELERGYDLNSKGFRSDEFHVRGDYNVLVIGCSQVFGYGLNKQDTVGEMLREHFEKQYADVVVYNLGCVGASNDYIGKTIATHIDKFSPDFVWVNFTFISRREYITQDGETARYLDRPKFVETNKHKLPQLVSLKDLSNNYHNLMNSYSNFKLVENSLNARSIPWLWSVSDQRMLSLKNYMRPDLFVDYFAKIDVASDRLHPGAASNLLMFEKILKCGI